MKIFLDDIREPKECLSYMHNRIGALNPIYDTDWVVVRTYKDFCKVVSVNMKDITHISFDHDLADCFQSRETTNVDEWFDINGNREYTGYDCAKFIKELYGNEPPIMFVHSMNPVGAQKIINLFK